MAAYAALASLLTMIDQLQQHTLPPVSLDEHQLESLAKNAIFLQEFLEGYNSPFEDESDPLESRIADVACAIKAAIESYIAHVILLRLSMDEKSNSGEEISVEQIDSDEETSSCEETDSDEEIGGDDETDSGEVNGDDDEKVSGEQVGSGDETDSGEEIGDDDETESGEEVGSGDESDSGEEIGDDDEIESGEEDGSGDEIDSGEEISDDDETESGEEVGSGEVIVFGKTKISVKEMDLGEEINCINFYQDLQQVMEEMHFLKIEVMGIVKEKSVAVQNQLKKNIPMQKNSAMVVFDEVSHEIMDKLTRGRHDRHVIPITGMGGIGKTTLAKYIYEQPLIKEHFDIRAWATISQQYSIKDILCELLSQAKNENKEELGKLSEGEVGLGLYKYLSGRRYLIIVDDLWSIDAWDKIQSFFPNDTNSRILVTSRLSKLGSQLDNYSLEMKFLDGVSSWNLFSKIVFGEKSCPLELEEIGKKIVENCRGLPLSIVVTGGLLQKLEHTKECWESIKKKLSSLVNLENDKQCLKILKMSYDHLPAYLKPCFLYMGVFEEDCIIFVSELKKLWVYEGFVKPTSGNMLETIALQYFNELVSRNLIIVHKMGFAGNIKYCKIHDLLRDFCLKQAEKERFYDVIGQYTPQCDYRTPTKYFPHDVIQIMNLRYLNVDRTWMPKIPSFVNLLWNLCTLIIVDSMENTMTFDIWKMPQLRHVEFCREGIYLPNPLSSTNNMVIMENLQTLKGVSNFNCSEEVVKRLPNIRKLRITYQYATLRSDGGDSYSLYNLECMSKLESLYYEMKGGSYDYLRNLTFPHSLMKLTIRAGSVYLFYKRFYLDEVMEKLGSLPLLQKLSVNGGCFRSHKWEIGEGQFPSLISLSLESFEDFECWSLDASSMPRLEHLYFSALQVLKEIPQEIGEISTLKSIRFSFASESALKSLKKMVEEQEDLHGILPFHVEGSGQSMDPELLNWKAPGIEITAPVQCCVM